MIGAVRVGDELLSNVSRDSRASHVCVGLRDKSGSAVLTVSDDGVGIDAGVLTHRLSEGHVGIASQRARIEAAGGQMIIGPGDDIPGAAGPGTTVEVWLPETPRSIQQQR